MPQLPRALSYKGDAASDAQSRQSDSPNATAAVSPLHSMRRPPEFAHYAEYGGMEERTESEYQLFTSGDLCIFH